MILARGSSSHVLPLYTGSMINAVASVDYTGDPSPTEADALRATLADSPKLSYYIAGPGIAGKKHRDLLWVAATVRRSVANIFGLMGGRGSCHFKKTEGLAIPKRPRALP